MKKKWNEIGSKMTVKIWIDNEYLKNLENNLTCCKYNYNTLHMPMSPHEFVNIAVLFRQICKILLMAMACPFLCVCVCVLLSFILAKIKYVNMTFVDFDICRRRASLRKLYSVHMTYIFDECEHCENVYNMENENNVGLSCCLLVASYEQNDFI